MTLKMSFMCIARCRVYSNNDEEESYTEDLELNLNLDQAMNILLRFSAEHVSIDGYKIYFHQNDLGSTNGIVLIKDDKKYVVKNMNQFISEVHEGYFRLLALNKFSSILEYDFGDNLDESQIKDEFE